MKNLKHILILCFIASFALGSCSKMEPLKKATVTESADDAVVSKLGATGEEDSEGVGITDPDHDEDHDKDNVSSSK